MKVFYKKRKAADYLKPQQDPETQKEIVKEKADNQVVYSETLWYDIEKDISTTYGIWM
ncbi:hypothetical protein Q3A90_16855 [Priestia megaterium]|uniref:hypothetical protein n=1 Tax=Priestia megaterium TaxID=1404 RepID=UPI0026753A64|nr:hypothetical protein [Priestia megaterium]WKU21443.1 hypothetical protein Q3A90_16855 [Priestia megaterium]